MLSFQPKAQGASSSQHFPLPAAGPDWGYREQGQPGPLGSVSKSPCQPRTKSA